MTLRKLKRGLSSANSRADAWYSRNARTISKFGHAAGAISTYYLADLGTRILYDENLVRLTSIIRHFP